MHRQRMRRDGPTRPSVSFTHEPRLEPSFRTWGPTEAPAYRDPLHPDADLAVSTRWTAAFVGNGEVDIVADRSLPAVDRSVTLRIEGSAVEWSSPEALLRHARDLGVELTDRRPRLHPAPADFSVLRRDTITCWSSDSPGTLARKRILSSVRIRSPVPWRRQRGVRWWTGSIRRGSWSGSPRCPPASGRDVSRSDRSHSSNISAGRRQRPGKRGDVRPILPVPEDPRT